LITPAARLIFSVQDDFGATWARHAPHARAERLVLGDLSAHRDPAGVDRPAFERTEEDGLADAAQAGHEHRLLRVSAAEALEQDLESLELSVAADERGRRGAGIRRVRVGARVQTATLSGFAVLDKAG
jgi:hypothetical protein